MTSHRTETAISTRTADQGARKVSDILADARKHIEKPENWDHSGGGGECEGGPCCAQVAIYRVVGDRDIKYVAYRALARAADIPIEDHFSCSRIWRWNDAPERTHSEVLAAFDRAIEAATEQERIADTLVAAQHLEQRPSTEGSNRTEQRE